MTLRAVLMPPELEEARVNALASLAERAQSLLEATDPSVTEVVRQFNERAGVHLEEQEFLFYGYTDARSFTTDALLRAQVRAHSDITREELVEIVSLIKGGASPPDYWLALLQANVPDPRVSDLIFWPNQYFGKPDADVNAPEFQLSPAQIIDQVLAYEPKTLSSAALPLPSNVTDD